MTAEAAKTLRRTAIVATLLLAILAAGAISTAKSRADAPVLGTAEPNYLYAGDKKRRFLLKETKRAGGGLVRLNAFWFMVARNEPTDPRDPADPRYDFRQLDDAVREADRQGLEIMMTLQRAPEWAESEPNGEDRGAWKPDVSDYGDYAHAVATRYSGTYADPEEPGATLPRVRYYQAWNEGNLEKFYAPQRVGGESVSADRYRRLLNNAYDEFKAVDPDNQVVVAGTGPRGPSDNNRTAAAEWWRDLLCLKQRNNRPKRNCTPANFDVFDHHPITVEDRPTHRGRNGEVFIVDFRKLSRLLNIAEREDTVGGPRNHEEWATEIYWETDPPETRRGFPELTVARFLEQGIYLLAKQKVDLILNFFMIDAPLTTPGDVANVQGGLLNVKGRRKDSFTAFRFPFVTDPRRKGSKSLAWGIAPRDGKVRIEKLTGRRSFRKWRSVTSVQASKGEVFQRTVRLRGKQKVRARIRGDKSLVWIDK